MRSNGWSARSAFARTQRRHEENGTITHAELQLDGVTIYLSTPAGYASPRTLRSESESARRAYDNPWVIDGHFVEIDDLEHTTSRHERQARRSSASPAIPGTAIARTRPKIRKDTAGCSVSALAEHLWVVRRRRGGPWDWSRDLRRQDGWDEHAAIMDRFVDEGFILLGGPLEGEREVLHVVEPSRRRDPRPAREDNWTRNGMLETVSSRAGRPS